MNIPGLSPSDQQILNSILREKGYLLTSPSNSAVDPLLAISTVEAAAPGTLKSIVGSAPDPTSFRATTTNYRANPRGNILGDALISGAEMLGTGYGKYNAAATPMAQGAQNAVTGAIGRLGGATKLGSTVGRFAGSAPVLGALKAVPLVGAAGAALGAGDIVFGNESAGNKVMDATAMTIGGLLGMAGGPLGAAAGAGIGKSISDGIQFVVGGGKSAEERKMEEALRMLQTGGMY